MESKEGGRYFSPNKRGYNGVREYQRYRHVYDKENKLYRKDNRKNRLRMSRKYRTPVGRDSYCGLKLDGVGSVVRNVTRRSVDELGRSVTQGTPVPTQRTDTRVTEG